METRLQANLDKAMKQVVGHFVPLVQANPPDALLGGMFNGSTDKAAIRSWIEEVIRRVFPAAKDLSHTMVLEERYKDVTFEMLNRPEFLESVQRAFPLINWDKACNEFKAAGESGRKESAPRA